MPSLRPQRLVGDAELQRAARIAGLKGFETPTLEQVERRRFELLGVTFFVLVALSLCTVASSYLRLTPEWLRLFGGTATAVRLALVGLAVGFAAYTADKERNLRKLSRILINERVLHAALSNRLKELSLLREAGKAVIAMLELEDVLGVILNAAFELLEADEGSVLLAERAELVVAAAAGHARLFVGDRHGMDVGLSGYVARTREPLVIHGQPDLSEFGGLVPDKPPIASALVVPLEAKGELLGILNLSVLTGTRRYDEYDLRALGLFSEHAAMAIRHARVLQRERDLRMQILEVDRVRAELVASMAHDLKTPLTTMLGVAKAVSSRAEEFDPDKQRLLLASMEGQALKMLRLIERLLEAARSHARDLPLAPVHADLGPRVEDLSRTFAAAHGRRIVLEKQAPAIPVYADLDAVDQVLANLLENAVKYTPAEGTILVRLTHAGDWATVRVEDEGEGIPEPDVPFLFLPFRRGRAPGTGVGLGLFIVANLVRAMGGEVSVEALPGRGTAFGFTLPSTVPEMRGAREAKA